MPEAGDGGAEAWIREPPHCLQNRAPGWLAVQHAGQRMPWDGTDPSGTARMTRPHCMQKRAPGRISRPHVGHFIAHFLSLVPERQVLRQWVRVWSLAFPHRQAKGEGCISRPLCYSS
jgi:hypothetical protein